MERATRVCQMSGAATDQTGTYNQPAAHRRDGDPPVGWVEACPYRLGPNAAEVLDLLGIDLEQLLAAPSGVHCCASASTGANSDTTSPAGSVPP